MRFRSRVCLWDYTERESKIGFGLTRKLPRLNDRKRGHIELILSLLRSFNPGALAQPKSPFLNHDRYTLRDVCYGTKKTRRHRFWAGGLYRSYLCCPSEFTPFIV